MKVLITGNACSGKTTLGRSLSTRLGLPLYSIDRYLWLPGWIKRDRESLCQKINEITSGDDWLIEGVSYQVIPLADVIIFVHVKVHVAYWRALKRTRQHLFKSRPEMAEGCSEISVIGKLIRIIWVFHKEIRANSLGQLKQLPEKQKVYHVHSRRDPDELVNQLLAQSNS